MTMINENHLTVGSEGPPWHYPCPYTSIFCTVLSVLGIAIPCTESRGSPMVCPALSLDVGRKALGFVYVKLLATDHHL